MQNRTGFNFLTVISFLREVRYYLLNKFRPKFNP